jgi:excisionase family DNA binding protein
MTAGGLRAARPRSTMSIWPPEKIDLSDRRRWLTIAEAAAYARVSERTVRRWLREHPIAVSTPSGRHWIDRERLLAPASEMSAIVK